MKRVLVEVIGAVLCLIIGMTGGSYLMANGAAGSQNSEKSINMSSQQEISVAVVNQDAGVIKNNETIYYANKLIEYPGENYKSTSLEEAKSGLENGSYGAYIVIPSSFSASVDSINGTPQKAVFEYEVSDQLSENAKEDMLYEINNFQKSITTNVSYVYIDAILSEIHNIQDGSSTILANNTFEQNAVQNVSAENLIATVEFSELKENNDTVHPIDLTQQSTQLTGNIQGIRGYFHSALKEGQEAYAEVREADADAETALAYLEEGMSNSNPLYDDANNMLTLSGMDKVCAQIDSSNSLIVAQRAQLEQSIIDEINNYRTSQQALIDAENIQIQQNIDTSFERQLQKIDIKLAQAQQECYILAAQQSEEVNETISEYVAALQDYIDTQASSEAAKKMVSDIVIQQTRILLDEKDAEYTEYAENVEKNIAEANEEIERYNTGIQRIQEIAGQGREQELLEEIEQLERMELVQIPERPTAPNTDISNDIVSVDTSCLKDLFQLEQAMDKHNQEIQPPEVNIEAPLLEITLDSDDITYQLPEYILPEVTSINDNKLEDIEQYYYVDKKEIERTFKKDVVEAIISRNNELQNEFYLRAGIFLQAQNEYQAALDGYSPFAFVDEGRIENDIDSVRESIIAIENEMNDKGEEYLQYTSDVYQMANENISILRADMEEANEQTRENVVGQIEGLRSLLLESNQVNTELLEDFTDKLAFTRMGNLPYREAYEFIIDPFEYEKIDK